MKTIKTLSQRLDEISHNKIITHLIIAEAIQDEVDELRKELAAQQVTQPTLELTDDEIIAAISNGNPLSGTVELGRRVIAAYKSKVEK